MDPFFKVKRRFIPETVVHFFMPTKLKVDFTNTFITSSPVFATRHPLSIESFSIFTCQGMKKRFFSLNGIKSMLIVICRSNFGFSSTLQILNGKISFRIISIVSSFYFEYSQRFIATEFMLSQEDVREL
jgi:hypothetical protein